jgi:hypothetical protein
MCPKSSAAAARAGDPTSIMPRGWGPGARDPSHESGVLGLTYWVKRDALDRGAEGRTVDSDASFSVPASSFVGVRGDDLWVGKFARSGNPRAYPYTVTASGDLRSAGASIPVPTRTQGMAVTDDHFIFSRSFRRGRQHDRVGRAAGPDRQRADADRAQHGRGHGLRGRPDPRRLRARLGRAPVGALGG